MAIRSKCSMLMYYSACCMETNQPTDVYVLKINFKKKKKERRSWNTMNALLPLLSDDDDICEKKNNVRCKNK